MKPPLLGHVNRAAMGSTMHRRCADRYKQLTHEPINVPRHAALECVVFRAGVHDDKELENPSLLEVLNVDPETEILA